LDYHFRRYENAKAASVYDQKFQVPLSVLYCLPSAEWGVGTNFKPFERRDISDLDSRYHICNARFRFYFQQPFLQTDF